MKRLQQLRDRITQRVDLNLREMELKVDDYISGLTSLEHFCNYYALYGLTPQSEVHFRFKNSSLAGSYFLGRCMVENSLLYKSDVRGDELKNQGDEFKFEDISIPLHKNEYIRIRDSFLFKTSVHSFSHDPENPEEFKVRNTASMPYANIHGSPVRGSFLGAFSTIDLTTVLDCVVGEFACLQVGEMAHHFVAPGQIWIADGNFDFKYRHDPKVLVRYISHQPGCTPKGLLMDFVEERKSAFEGIFSTIKTLKDIEDDFRRGYCTINTGRGIKTEPGTWLSSYAMIKGNCNLDKNVLVAQRAFLEDSWLGQGANAQENCYLINSRLEGFNVIEHGAKLVYADLGENAFVGFNSFCRGAKDTPLKIGEGCIVMPHTIIDLTEPVRIPTRHLVWGHITCQADLKKNSIPLDHMAQVERDFRLGGMTFTGSGRAFVNGLKNRIERTLMKNGAFWDGTQHKGHAQKSRMLAFNIIQPYSEGDSKGIIPTMEITP